VRLAWDAGVLRENAPFLDAAIPHAHLVRTQKLPYVEQQQIGEPMIKRELTALACALLALGAAIGVLFLIHWYADKRDSVALIALLTVPLLVYVLLSGRLQEVTGPGGWGAKFRSLAQSSVEATGILSDIEPLQFVQKGSLRDLKALIGGLDPHLPRAMILRVGRPGFYDLKAIRTYLRALIASGAPTYVIFIEEGRRKFVGSASALQILTLLSEPENADSFMTELSEGGLELLSQNGILITEYLRPTDTNAVALQKFLDTNAAALVVVSADSTRPLGVVDRDRLVTKLLLKLTN
jgi:hypothetical protein